MKTEKYKFTKSEVKEMMKYYKVNTPEEALKRFAHWQGYCGGMYDIYIGKTYIKITELP